MRNKTLILKIEHGGLGDHLFLSHIPRIAKQSGRYNFVYLASNSEYRNKEIRQIVWETNPFVDGVTESAPTQTEPIIVPKNGNLLDGIMLSYGIDDGKRSHEPELYYKPNNIEELNSVNIFDANYISNSGHISRRKLEKVLTRDIGITAQMAPRNKTIKLKLDLPVLEAVSLGHYCDIVFSCNQFSCLLSGGSVLSAALGKPATVFYGHGVQKMFLHSRLHKYKQVTSNLARARAIIRHLLLHKETGADKP